MNHNADPTNARPAAELFRYGQTSVVEVFKKIGERIDVARLARTHALDPNSADSGAIVIMTRSNRTGTDGHHQHRNYILDGHVIADQATGDVRQISEIGELNDVTIGLNWQSPFGPTYPVTCIMQPHTTGAFEDRVTSKPDAPYSPPEQALAWLEQHV